MGVLKEKKKTNELVRRYRIYTCTCNSSAALAVQHSGSTYLHSLLNYSAVGFMLRRRAWQLQGELRGNAH